MSIIVRTQLGRQFHAEATESVLDAALRQGIQFPHDCRNGACGTCKGKVRAGEIAYPEGMPAALTPEEAERDYALFCKARPLTDLEIEIPDLAHDVPIRTFPCRVERAIKLAHDVIVLYLKLPDKQVLKFEPGQYIDVLMKGGETRAFSLANAPRGDARLELHVRHVPNGEFSGYVFGAMKENSLLRLRGPRGSFFLRNGSDRPIILMAGGTGFAPIKGMMEHALAQGDNRRMHFYWGVRALEDLYMDDLVADLADTYDNLHYVPVLSQPDPGDGWTGRIGLVHEAILADFADLSPYEVYTSGPPVMVQAARETFLGRGLDPAHMYSDSFDYAYHTVRSP